MLTVDNNQDTNASEEDKEALMNEIKRLMTLNVNKKNILKLTKCMKTINTEGVLYEKLIRVNVALSIRRRKIRVQPTAINRHRKGMPKKCTPILAGRPLKSNLNRNPKQKHSLKENIEKNLPNSKK